MKSLAVGMALSGLPRWAPNKKRCPQVTEYKNPLESELTHFGTLKLLLLEHERIEKHHAEIRRWYSKAIDASNFIVFEAAYFWSLKNFVQH